MRLGGGTQLGIRAVVLDPEEMTVEHFATLMAECEVYPERSQQIAARFGIESEQQQAQLEQQWRGRMTRDPVMSADYHGHYFRIREFLEEKRRNEEGG